MNIRPNVVLPLIVAGAWCARAFSAEPVPTSSGNNGLFAVSADAGTLGLGATAWVTLSEAFTVSAGYNGFGYNRDVNTSDVNYAGKLHLSNVPVLVSWHPFSGSFRLVGGVVFFSNKVDVVGRPNAGTTYTINGAIYTAAQGGNLTGTGKCANSTAPYAGLGWSKIPRGKGFGVFADLGVMFSGSPKVVLTASGPLSTDPTFKANLASEVKKCERQSRVRQSLSGHPHRSDLSLLNSHTFGLNPGLGRD